jgi:hypothetical protein
VDLLSHDGHTVTCGGCRTPLRAVVVSSVGLTLANGEVSRGESEGEFVDCENCGANLGLFDAFREEYARASGVA